MLLIMALRLARAEFLFTQKNKLVETFENATAKNNPNRSAVPAARFG